MATKLTYGIIAILIIGLTGAGVYVLSPEQLDAARTCTSSNVTGIFERFSSTNSTAYWTQNGTNKQLVCTKGKWIPTRDWMKLNNVTEAQMTGLPLEESDIDELGNPILNGTTIIVDKAGKLNIEGKTYDIKCPGCDKPPITKCVCKPGDDCKITDCMK